MKAARHVMALLVLALAAPLVLATARAELLETPVLAPQVAAGKLPPVAERLPVHPLVVKLDGKGLKPGRHGGELRMLIGRAKDVRLMVVYGYARLVGYDRDFEIRPDILESVDVDEGRRFTLHLRKGHKWSDGYPFTSEDFRYWWEDVANNKMLSPIGPERILIVDGEKPTVEFPDETTVRYTWSQPNPYFLPALAGTRPLYIYRPAHYLKKYHAKYADPEKLKKMVAEKGVRNWAVLHNRYDDQYKNNNPALPSLQPWVVITRSPAQRFEFLRNPYFHRVDANGRQLPYIDKVVMSVTSGPLIPAKAGSGDVDLQARGLAFSNYPFLKNGEKEHGYAVHLWRIAKGSNVALYPNLNINDPAWRALFRDVRFRRALSLASNRKEINQVVYFGLATPSNNTVLEGSPLFRPIYRDSWAQHDVKLANRLLDEIGLTKRDDRGVRLLPDGRPLEIVIETAGESQTEIDVLSLIHDAWAKAGIAVFTRPSQREVLRNRIFAGETMISVWTGLENGLPTPNTPPDELAPVDQYQLEWPKWGQYFQTKGRSGKPADLPAAKELLDLRRQWIHTDSREARSRIWHRMLGIHADRMFTIGLISGALQPVVVSNRLHNVPAEGIYNWEPGADFGIYRPDTFWFGPKSSQAAGR